jgi:hypothetical protein
MCANISGGDSESSGFSPADCQQKWAKSLNFGKFCEFLREVDALKRFSFYLEEVEAFLVIFFFTVLSIVQFHCIIGFVWHYKYFAYLEYVTRDNQYDTTNV